MVNITKTTFRNIAVSDANYFALKALGQAGDSFNDVITELVKARTKKEN